MYSFLYSLVPILLFIGLKTKKSFHMLQQNWYNDGNRYIDWIFRNKKKVFIGFDILFPLFLLGYFIKTSVLMGVFAFFYTFVLVMYFFHMKGEQTKKKLVFTKRVQRLSITTILLYVIIIGGICFSYDVRNLGVYYALLGLLAYLQFFVVWLVNIINKPVEKLVFYHFKRMAIRRLKTNLCLR